MPTAVSFIFIRRPFFKFSDNFLTGRPVYGKISKNATKYISNDINGIEVRKCRKLLVDLRTLTPLVLVRIQVPQPTDFISFFDRIHRAQAGVLDGRLTP